METYRIVSTEKGFIVQKKLMLWWITLPKKFKSQRDARDYAFNNSSKTKTVKII